MTSRGVDDTPSLSLTRLVVRHVRNVETIELEPGRTNILFGDNGQGKTSLLEAIYVLCTSRSFRASKLREVASHTAEGFQVRGSFEEMRDGEALLREQIATTRHGSLHVRLDGNKPSSLAEYAVKSPVVVFHPDELALSSGPASVRRRMLDRVALYGSPRSMAASAAYNRALRARRELLQRLGPGAPELDAYEDIAARAGAELTRARARAVEALATDVLAAFTEIAQPGLCLEFAYEPGGSDDADHARKELAERRPRDARAPTATFGPHRDDLALRLDGHSARLVASQGQHRAITLALKAAESATIARITGLEPIQLLDDVSSELDPSRTEALFRFLLAARGQLFLTTTRPELVEQALGARDARRFRLISGAIQGG